MSERQRLPNRRRQETVELEFGEHQYAISVGFDAIGAIREVFVTGQKQGSTLDATLDDAAIVISHHLQRGGTAAVAQEHEPARRRHRCRDSAGITGRGSGRLSC